MYKEFKAILSLLALRTYSKAQYYEGLCGLDLVYSSKGTEQKQLS